MRTKNKSSWVHIGSNLQIKVFNLKRRTKLFLKMFGIEVTEGER